MPSPATGQRVPGSLARAWFAALLQHRRLALIGCGVVLLALGAGAARLDVDLNIESMFPQDDGQRVNFREYTATFGRDDDQLILLARAPGLADPATILAVRDLASGLRELPWLSDIDTFLDVPYAWLDDDLELGLDTVGHYLLRNGEPLPDRWAALLASLSLEGPLLHNFLDPAGPTVVLLLRLDPRHADNQGRMAATEGVRRWLAARPWPSFSGFALSGMPAARADGMRMIQRDQSRLLPLALVVAAVMLGAFFRRGRDVALVMAHIAMTLVVTFGVMGHLGLRFSVLSSVIPVILVTTGSAYSVQILARLRARASLGESTDLPDLFTEMLGPVFLANVTTIVGFASLLHTDMQLLSEFAWISAGGVFVAFALSFTALPLLVAVFPGPILDPPTPAPGPAPAATGAARRSRSRLARLPLWLGCLVTRHPRAIFTGLLVIGIIGFWLASHATVRAYVFDDFAADSPLMLHIRAAEATCRGILPMAVVVRATGPETVLRLHYLAKAASAAAWLRTLPEVGKVDSPTDLIGQVFALLLADGGGPRLPPNDTTLAEIIRLFLLRGTSDPGLRLVSDDLKALRVQFRVRDLESGAAARLIDRIRRDLASLNDDRTSVQLSGTTMMIQEAYRGILGNLFGSFAIVIVFTLLVLSAAFRHLPSIVVGFFGNLIPVTGIIALMAVLDVPFKPSTIMVFGIALGLADDNTIYFMREYWRDCDGRRSRRRLVIRALRRTAWGMIQTSVALVFGFLVLTGSEFEAQYLVGLLVSFSVVAALAYDLLFIPAGMSLWGPTRLTSADTAPSR